MTPDQVERVARAFYGAEHPGDWDEAPAVLRERFRDFARTAILLLHRQASRGPSGPILAKELEPDRDKDMVQLSS
ncbi:hypothetical protein [Microvirga yunnanensis]|uniref:hypothetical protein n=1 Tax=Microvirga yunnanensis TaxID=2953740 RepID=UPI0021C979D7|nr:hypothetical protein [Microvirga sp. HBU65207]